MKALMFRPGIFLLLWTLSISSIFASDFDNADFSKGKSGWSGDGKLVYLNEDGSVSPEAHPGTTSAIEISLNGAQFKELSQRFTTPKGGTNEKTSLLNGMIVFKASPDYKINEKSSGFSKDISWTAGGHWYWHSLVRPKVDLCLRLDTVGNYSYQLSNVIPGGDWQTLPIRFDNVETGKPANFSIIVPPGDGSLLIKSACLGK